MLGVEEKYSFKIVILGEASVGKSSLIHRFYTNKFKENYLPTMGVDIQTSSIDPEEIRNVFIDKKKKINLIAWDVAGQSAFKEVREQYYAGVKGFIVVYDVSRPETFILLDEWLDEIKKYIEIQIPIIFVGNKIDLVKDGLVNKFSGDIEDITSKYNIQNYQYFETSAKTGVNVRKAYVELVNEIFKNYSI